MTVVNGFIVPNIFKIFRLLNIKGKSIFDFYFLLTVYSDSLIVVVVPVVHTNEF